MSDTPENPKPASERLLWQVEKLAPHLEEMAIEEQAGVVAILQLLCPAPEAVRQRVLSNAGKLAAKLEDVSPGDCQTVIGILAALCKARGIDEQQRQMRQRALAIK